MTSPPSVDDGAERLCLWCRAAPRPTRGRYCSKLCRQKAWRVRKLLDLEAADGSSKRLVYADPAYPGMAKRYYGNEPTYAGEVDHEALIAKLVTYDGWALSTSEKALRDVLPLCPKGVRIGSWTKPIGAAPLTRGPHNCWEPVIYVPARLRRPGVRDHLSAQPARFGGTLVGRKPIAFCTWIFALLGAQPGDSLDDLFPGTGVVGSCWLQVSVANCSSRRASQTPRGDECRELIEQTPVRTSPKASRDERRPGTHESLGDDNDSRRPSTLESFGAVHDGEALR